MLIVLKEAKRFVGGCYIIKRFHNIIPVWHCVLIHSSVLICYSVFRYLQEKKVSVELFILLFLKFGLKKKQEDTSVVELNPILVKQHIVNLVLN